MLPNIIVDQYAGHVYPNIIVDQCAGHGPALGVIPGVRQAAKCEAVRCILHSLPNKLTNGAGGKFCCKSCQSVHVSQRCLCHARVGFELS